jgi:hypothetical protein
MLGVEVMFAPAETDAGYAEAAKATRHVEAQRRHALEVEVRARAAVHDLELRLAVAARWVPGDEKWVAVSVMVHKRRYQRALDHLQGLIISRMFELAKCNLSGMGEFSLCAIGECSPFPQGYKLRKHIAKALQRIVALCAQCDIHDYAPPFRRFSVGSGVSREAQRAFKSNVGRRKTQLCGRKSSNSAFTHLKDPLPSDVTSIPFIWCRRFI